MSKMVIGLPKNQVEHEGICKGCTQGKNVKKLFSSSDRKSKGVLDIIHSYVCGPMSDASLSRYVYYASFIDDFSRKTWIYFLKSKSEVFKRSKNSRNLLKAYLKRR
jgi:hypothetical protein